MKQKGKGLKKRERENLAESIKIVIRYLILLALMLILPLIYIIFTPLTIYPVVYLLKIFFNSVLLISDKIVINLKTVIQVIPACIAGSAYLLLLIVNLSTPMNFKKRIFTIITSFILLLVLNIFRIFLLILLYENNYIFFDLTHRLFWYGLSTIFVVLIWFLSVRIYSINEIPIYSDIKYLVANLKKS